jgi:hypothetical protein
MRLKAPLGIVSVFIAGREYPIANGFVDVDMEAIGTEYLKSIGFTEATDEPAGQAVLPAPLEALGEATAECPPGTSRPKTPKASAKTNDNKEQP